MCAVRKVYSGRLTRLDYKGIKIVHVWEENVSLVISICGLEVHEIGTYKKSLFVGHPVLLRHI